MVRKKYHKKFPVAEVVVIFLIILTLGVSAWFFVDNMKFADYVVETNAFLRPLNFIKRKISWEWM